MKDNDKALAEAFAVLNAGLRGYLIARLPDAAIADDLLQDVFVKALKSRQSGRDIENLNGWLYAATRTTLADYYRKKMPQAEMLHDDMAEQDANGWLYHQKLSNCMKPLMYTLPEHYRDTLIACDLEGKTMRQLADDQELSLSAIKSRASRGRALLKAKIEQCCHVETAQGVVTDFYPHKNQEGCDNDLLG